MTTNAQHPATLAPLPSVTAQLVAGTSDEYRAIFNTLVRTDVSKHVEKKNGMSYLSWAYAIDSLLRVAPDATFKVCEFGGELVRNLVTGELVTDEFGDVKVHNGEPFQKTAVGYFIKAKVKVKEVVREMRLPVIDTRNKPIAEPNAFDINTSGMRCLVKAIAMHGLGLFLYQGEDLPAADSPITAARTTTLKVATQSMAAAAPDVAALVSRIALATSDRLRSMNAGATAQRFPDPHDLAAIQRAIAARARQLGIDLQPALAAVA